MAQSLISPLVHHLPLFTLFLVVLVESWGVEGFAEVIALDRPVLGA